MRDKGETMTRRWSAVVLAGLGLVLMGCGLIEPPLLPPTTAPADLSASTGAYAEQIALSWRAVERAATYEIQRALARDGTYESAGTVGATQFVDAVVPENQGKWYWYRVRACNAAGCGPWSEPVQGYAGRPPAPENVQASEGEPPDKIRISWDPVPGATYYQVFRDRVENGTYDVVVASVVEEDFVYDANVSPATWYWYKVRACNDFGCSELSRAAAGYCGPRPIPFAEDEEPY